MGTLKTRVNWFTTRPPVANAAAATLAPALVDLTKAELSTIAKERGLNPWGTKAEILGRLSDG